DVCSSDLASGQEARASRPVFDDIVLTKNVDDCSVPLYTLLFQERVSKSVVISLYGGTTEVMRMTLTEVFITSITDTESFGSVPIERATLSYGKITILDPITNTSSCFDRARLGPC